MKRYLRLFAAKHYAWIFWLAVICFNNWVLGIFINHNLFRAGGSVSEFSATSQAHHWLFRGLDIASGLAFVGVAYILSKKGRASVPGNKLIVWATLLLGLGNMLDAFLPLPCAGTLDKLCSAPVRLDIHRVSLPDHVFSSLIIGACYILIPLGGWLYARHCQTKKLSVTSLITIAVTLLFFVLLVGESFFEGSAMGRLASLSQELQMLILGWWFIELHKAQDPGESR